MRRAGALAMLALAAVLAVVLSLAIGAVGLGPGEVVAGLAGSGDPAAVTIVRELRLPRALLAAVVGGALSLAGATFQALLRNPLAEPYILGVSSGAAGDSWAFFSFGNGSGTGATLLTPNAWHQATITVEGAAGQLRVSVGSEELGAQPGYLDFPDVVRFAMGVDDLDGELTSARVRFDDVQCSAE